MLQQDGFKEFKFRKLKYFIIKLKDLIESFTCKA